MSAELPASRHVKMTGVHWLICIIASIGFAFDIYELLMLPLVVGPALQELVGAAPGSDLFQTWVGRLFFVPAFAGGIFGLLGGYLTDRLGRRRVLTWSILLYAFSAFSAGFSTNIWMLLGFRCLIFIGVCVEFVAAVAWLAELFPDREQREKVLGYTQAFSSVGGLMVAVANGLAVTYGAKLPAIPFPEFLTGLGEAGRTFNAHADWRYTLMSGLIPAIPLIVIRPFLPESPAWQKKKEAGALVRPRISELFAPGLAKATILTCLMFAFSFGGAFGAIQHIPQIVPGLPEVKAKVEEELKSEKATKAVAAALSKSEFVKQLEGKSPEEQGQLKAIETKKVLGRLKAPIERGTASSVTKVQEVGGLFGRFLLAILVLKIASQQKLIRVFVIPGLFVLPIVFSFAAIQSLNGLYYGIFFCGLLTVGQFSFWGNYLPRVYPMRLRGTGESFAANIGGRLIGTSFAWVTANLAKMDFMPGTAGPERLALTAAIVGTTCYVANLILSFFLPEPPEELPE